MRMSTEFGGEQSILFNRGILQYDDNRFHMKRILQNTLLVLASMLAFSLVLEAGMRIHTGNYSFENTLENHLRITMARYPVKYDELLGWVSKEGVSGHESSSMRITILEGGIRSNGNNAIGQNPPGQRPILAVGDSYTFGYEVRDEETWPAILEDLTGRRVINGGGFAYGMDQSLLRARQLIDRYQPDTVIYSFIPNDIWRNQISARSGVNKPYFDIQNGSLALKNTPVPPPALTDFGNPGIREYLGYSVFVHYFMMRSKFAMWWIRGNQWKDRNVHGDATGEEIACLIIRELDEIAETRNIAVYLLAQYGKPVGSPYTQNSRRAIKCATPRNLVVVDLYNPLLEIKNRDRHEFRSLFTEGKRHHMTYQGNRFVAKTLKDAMSGISPAGN